MTADEHHHRRLHFARIRRAKFWLKFMPRRARFHTYPVVGRFAAFARKRSYLWSFNYTHIRPALYLGSVLTLLPVLGQVPIAFVLCLLFRANFMLLGGLQFVSNMLTFPFIIAATLKVGFFIIELTGLDRFTGIIPSAFSGGVSQAGETSAAAATSLSSKVVLYGSALTIGSIICGLLLGAALDLLWCRFMVVSARHRLARHPVTAVVTPHDTNFPPSP